MEYITDQARFLPFPSPLILEWKPGKEKMGSQRRDRGRKWNGKKITIPMQYDLFI